MAIFQNLSTLALRGVFQGACKAIGSPTVGDSIDAITAFLTERFTDHSLKLTRALQEADRRAWTALELAIAGDSFWEVCKGALARREDQSFQQHVRAFLDGVRLPEIENKVQFRKTCLHELRAARQAGMLDGEPISPTSFIRRGLAFVRYADPVALLKAESQMVGKIADHLAGAGHKNLALLISLRPAEGSSLLVVAVRYFFRRAVETDPQLFQGLAFAQLESLQQSQERGFAELQQVLDKQAEHLETLLNGVHAVVVETHDAVLDVQAEQKRLAEQNKDILQQGGDIYRQVVELQNKLDLLQREVRPRDSLSVRNDEERKLIRQVVARYRALPEGQRQEMPALLNAIGKLEVAAGEFQDAQQDFVTVTTLVSDLQARGEAHMNAYRAALERRDWSTALQELVEAVKLDGKRFAPFPVGKYKPIRILGAGGFGVAFLCRHRELNADVVVKTLHGDHLDRSVDEVFAEARLLYQLDHPSIIRMLDCGYAVPTTKSRPFFVMSYFDGKTLEEQVAERPLSAEDAVAVTKLMTRGLQAAHDLGIYHRDVKPANVLVRKDAGGWQVKLIDFGLAFRNGSLANTARTASTRDRSIIGHSIAGTIDYAAPEQMGRLPGVPVAGYSDIYGLGKTCCYALFRTTQPLPKHWQGIPTSLASVLGRCLEERPEERPVSCAEVLQQLSGADVAYQAGREGRPDWLDDIAMISNNQSGAGSILTEKRRQSEIEPIVDVRPAAPAIIPKARDEAKPSRRCSGRDDRQEQSAGVAPTNTAERMHQVRLLDKLRQLLERYSQVVRAKRKWPAILLSLLCGIPIGFFGGLGCCGLLIEDKGVHPVVGVIVAVTVGLVLLGGVFAGFGWNRRIQLAHAQLALEKKVQESIKEYPDAIRSWGGKAVLDNAATIQEIIRTLEAALPRT